MHTYLHTRSDFATFSVNIPRHRHISLAVDFSSQKKNATIEEKVPHDRHEMQLSRRSMFHKYRKVFQHRQSQLFKLQ